jgi:hypothetical protein
MSFIECLHALKHQLNGGEFHHVYLVIGTLLAVALIMPVSGRGHGSITRERINILQSMSRIYGIGVNGIMQTVLVGLEAGNLCPMLPK